MRGAACPHPAPGTRPAPSRRRVLAGGALLASLLPALAACAAPAGMRGITLSRQRLNELLARSFPYTRGFSGLADLTLQSPRLRLLPESNRLGTALDVVLAERVTGGRFGGGMDLDYGLRFDAQQGAIRMADVRVNRLDIDPLPPTQRALVAQYAPRVAEQLLADLVLYRLPAEQLALARDLGLGVGALRVLPEGLRIDLVPQGLR
ncbi:DUF1439 domain-containing protein [Ottowia sp.]|jgi:hypothetical protein|uniref:DUF1439 domain-containing protein n=1 Tax=Ottowia sp. TaxID=1898956 RepID=UPI0025E7EBB0|nr:DUF1439 domain-containing protein [Ottowia sp.]MBK6614858.1 DUF1439 domain-containing protein [Ottowia sp.]MBK6745941.1 DUF1439 domain-containing protein [Ottowia sp.]